MDLEIEKKRLLNLIEVDKLYSDINVNLDNKDLIIKPITDERCNLTIISDIIINPDELKKYDTVSEITLNYEITDESYNTINNNYVSYDFDDILFSYAFMGKKTVEYEAEDLNLEDIGEILIEIETNLFKKSDDDEKLQITITIDMDQLKEELQKNESSKYN